MVARKLAKAVKDLGPLIQTKLENEMRHEKANGDLKKTRDACVQVLSSLELDEINEARRNGRANAARGDANRPDVGSQAGKRTGFHKGSNPNKKEKDENKPWEWRDWKPSDGSCTHCTEVLNEPACGLLGHPLAQELPESSGCPRETQGCQEGPIRQRARQDGYARRRVGKRRRRLRSSS